jgi:hypothetical protein
MAVDSQNKRRSKAFYYRRTLLPVPDGEIDQRDRQHKGWKYQGVPSGIFGSMLEIAMAEMFAQVSLDDDAEAFCAEMFAEASRYEPMGTP